MIGQTLGKYRVQDRIGRGGMGTVYLAVDETLRREVAIKVLNSELNDPEIARRFRAEAVTVARLNHPGIATVYELFEHDSQWLMVMEFVRGETLEHMVERTGPLPVDRAADLCIQALTALAHAHSMGVVHRDLKPANLMVTESGVVKVMDFGIARVAGSEHLTTAGFMMGTPAYMSPEQVLGHEIDARADLYAMGVVLYRLCTAKLPFKGDSPFAMAQSQVNDPPTPVGLMRAGMPAWVELVIGRSLSKAPEDRFQTADEFRETIKRGIAGLPIDVAPNAFVPPELLLTAPPGTMPALTPTGQTGQTGARPTTGSTPAVVSRPITQPVIDPDMTVMSGNLPPLGPGTGQIGPSSGRTAQTGPQTGQTAAPGSATGQTAMGTGAVAAASTAQMAAAGTAPMASPTGATAQTPLAAGPVTQTSQSPTKKSSGPLMGIAAGVLIVAAFAFWFWYRAHQAAVAEQALAAAATQAAADAAAAAAAAAAAPIVQLETPPPVAPPPVATPAPPPTPATGAVTEPPAGAAPAGARGEPGVTPGTPPGATTATGAAGAAGARGARGAVPEVSDAHVLFPDAKILILNGKKGQEQDVIVNFVAGQISVAPKKGGAAIWTIGYKILAHATYIHAKDPKWDATLPSPPDGLDIPGFMRGARHWLVLQAHVPDPGYVILHLDDANWSQLLDTLETRTGIKVDRPSAGGK